MPYSITTPPWGVVPSYAGPASLPHYARQKASAESADLAEIRPSMQYRVGYISGGPALALQPHPAAHGLQLTRHYS